jgi:flagellar biosynthetic protein FliR
VTDILASFPLFLLVFVRLTVFFAVAPILMNRNLPAQFKIGLAFFLALISLPIAGTSTVITIDGLYLILLLKEMLVGLCLGFVASLVLYAVQIAGIFIDLQIGFAMASVFDPQTGVTSPLTGKFKYVLAMIFLLSLNGHHYLIEGILRSYDWIPVDQLSPAFTDGRVSTFIVETFSNTFTMAFLIAAPLVGALFLVDVALGIVAKTVPQMNVFVVGLPLKIMTNFMILVIVIPTFFYVLQKLFKNMVTSIQAIIRILGV